MRTLLVFLALTLFAGCGENDSGAGDAKEGAATAIVEPEDIEPASALVGDDLLKVCRIGQGFRVGREPATIDARLQSDELVRLSYTRDDGKAFRYDCKIEDNVIRTRMIDEAGPGSGPGVWSGRGSITTFQIDGSSITLRDEFSDGSFEEQKFAYE